MYFMVTWVGVTSSHNL